MPKTPKSKAIDEPFHTGPEAARVLKVDPATIRRWKSLGAPCHLLGKGLVRYKLSELLAWRATW